ncbi:MAG: hypothetical protein L6V93_01215 [Clostridiales bacterium]|nr:MAG: hypothetical protein L6V93_01215 [Clostridiales bacterium]
MRPVITIFCPQSAKFRAVTTKIMSSFMGISPFNRTRNRIPRTRRGYRK